MKNRSGLLHYSVIFMFVFALSACEGDQGDTGPQGAPGPAGAVGTTGANGTGFDELTQYGNVEVTVSGTIPEDEDFSQKMNFNYMPSDGISSNSVVYKNSDTQFRFEIGRENKGKIGGRVKESSNNKNTIAIDFNVDGDEVYITEIDLFADVVTDDFKTFEIYDYNYYEDSDFDAVISDYTYDASTGKLKFNFTYTIAAEQNNIDADITITGKADVIVFESMNNPK